MTNLRDTKWPLTTKVMVVPLEDFVYCLELINLINLLYNLGSNSFPTRREERPRKP